MLDILVAFYTKPFYVFYYFGAWCRTGSDSLHIDHVTGISGIALYEKMSSYSLSWVVYTRGRRILTQDTPNVSGSDDDAHWGPAAYKRSTIVVGDNIEKGAGVGSGGW